MGQIGVKVSNRRPQFAQHILTTRLDSFIEMRNECAHFGRPQNNPTPSDIRDYCEAIEEIAEGIIEVLEDHLATL